MAKQQKLDEVKATKLIAIQNAMADIEKTFGKGSIMQLGKAPDIQVEALPTGCLSLDYILGIGGLPRGRIIEIYGPESSGKTTLCLHIIAEAQKLGGYAAFIDAEHAIDTNYAQKLGVDVPELFLSQPDCGEQALEEVDTLVRSNGLDVIVIDSVAALVPRSEIEGEMGDAHMAVQDRLMSQALRKLTGAVAKSKTIVIFINQLRSKIGVMFGNPETTTGGNALKFYASIRLDIRRIAALKAGDKIIGNRTKIKVVKSKVSPPFKEIEVDILYNQGISKTAEAVDLGISLGIVKKSGAWYTYGEDRYQGKESMMQAFTDPILYDQIKTAILDTLKSGAIPESVKKEKETVQ